jgi:hypothetical protein
MRRYAPKIDLESYRVNTMTVRQAADVLEMDPRAVCVLIHSHVLATEWNGTREHQVLTSSVRCFYQQFLVPRKSA